MDGELVAVGVWDFNGSEGTTAASVGNGRLELMGGASLLLAMGAGSSDPEHYPPNHCLGIYNFPRQGTGPESAGVAFFVSTVGHCGVRVGLDVYPEALSSRWIRLQWTADGGVRWRNAEGSGESGNGLFELREVDWQRLEADLSGDKETDNNPSFGFRLVSAFPPGNSSYDAWGNHNPYSRFGLMFVDMVTVRARRRG